MNAILAMDEADFLHITPTIDKSEPVSFQHILSLCNNLVKPHSIINKLLHEASLGRLYHPHIFLPGQKWKFHPRMLESRCSMG